MGPQDSVRHGFGRLRRADWDEQVLGTQFGADRRFMVGQLAFENGEAGIGSMVAADGASPEPAALCVGITPAVQESYGNTRRSSQGDGDRSFPAVMVGGIQNHVFALSERLGRPSVELSVNESDPVRRIPFDTQLRVWRDPRLFFAEAVRAQVHGR